MTPRKRLLVLASTFPRWQGDTSPGFVLHLCKQLSRTFDVTVLAPHAPGALRHESLHGIEVKRFSYCFSRLETLAYDGGILTNLQHRPLKWFLVPMYFAALVFAAAREMRSGSYSAVHAHWLIPQGIAALLARALSFNHIPVLCTAHGGDLFALNGPVARWLKRRALTKCDALTFVSSSMLDRARQVAPTLENAAVLPMGVDLEHAFTPDRDVARDRATLLYAGRLVEKKGVPVLLQALSTVRDRFPDVKLQIAGDGPDRAFLEAQTERLGIGDHVDFIGAVEHEELPGLFRQATIFVMPSMQAKSGDQEGFGLVLVEAMGCATPAIVSDYPAVHDIVRDGSARLVPMGDSDALASACCDLLADDALRERLGQRGRANVASRFDWQVIGKRYIDVVQSIIAREPLKSFTG